MSGDIWSQKLMYTCLCIVVLCFSIYVLIIRAFRGNLLSNFLINGRVMWSQEVACILYKMCSLVFVMNCSSKINMLYYCVLCGLFFVYVVLLYTKKAT